MKQPRMITREEVVLLSALLGSVPLILDWLVKRFFFRKKQGRANK